MFFKKKSSKPEISCAYCNTKVSKRYSFCPHCGGPMQNPQEEQRDFGMLGKRDLTEDEFMQNMPTNNNLGVMDKMINSLMMNLMKSLDKQMREAEKQGVDSPSMPRGFKIEIGIPQRRQRKVPQAPIQQKNITDKQIQRMSALPRTQAKTSIKRLNDKVIYELNAEGIASPEDVFISKLEHGYEIKAIGDKNVYVNSLPVELPMKGFALSPDKLVIEFKARE